MRLQIAYTSAVLQHATLTNYKRFYVSNLISPSLIACFPQLARHCVFVTEYVSSNMREADNPNITKHVSLLFSRDAIEEHHKDIDREMKSVLLKIGNETELLTKDNLARGELIDSVRVSAELVGSEERGRRWSVDVESVYCKIKENDPPEYWGQVGLFSTDFVSATERYPWMPSDISEGIPF